jgi:hypothetical protein
VNVSSPQLFRPWLGCACPCERRTAGGRIVDEQRDERSQCLDRDVGIWACLDLVVALCVGGVLADGPPATRN